MFIPFNSLPGHARIWVYQANRKFSSSEIDIISASLTSFTEQWQVHGKHMQTSFKIYYDQFLILAADEGYNAASGCSIDGSVRVLKELSSKLKIDLLDRNAVAFKNEEVFLLPLKELKQKNLDGVWTKDTFVFNNLISVKDDIDKKWLLPAGDTWLKKYLLTQEVKV